MSTPEWQFKYTDNLIQIANQQDAAPSPLNPTFDVLGQSFLLLPSLKTYRSSSRYRLTFSRELIMFEMLYDTVMTEAGDSWRGV